VDADETLRYDGGRSELAAMARNLGDLYARLADLDGRRTGSLIAPAHNGAYRLAARALADDDALIERYPGLTPRETDVAILLSEGMSNRQIAARLFIGLRTAESHIERIYQKLGMSRTGVAVAVATWLAKNGQLLSAAGAVLIGALTGAR
jgi:DNA-binding CsgD family transcriptional regulator